MKNLYHPKDQLVCRKYVKAVFGVNECMAAFEGLDQTRTSQQQQEWAESADAAEANRRENIEGMDAYETQCQKCMVLHFPYACL